VVVGVVAFGMSKPTTFGSAWETEGYLEHSQIKVSVIFPPTESGESYKGVYGFEIGKPQLGTWRVVGRQNLPVE